MNKSDSIAKLAAALVKAQPAFETAKMDSVNPFFKSKYADLGAVWDAVRPGLKANGLAITQFPTHLEGKPALTTTLIHESGEWMEATYPLMVPSKDETSQGYGSAVTYARRYGLSAVLGVIADTDDDGNAASKPQKPAARPPEPATQEQMTPQRWLEESAKAVKTMDRTQLDDFTTKQADRMARVKTLNPGLHDALVKAIQARQQELF